MATANTEFTRLDSVEKDKIEAILDAPNLPSVSSTDNGKILKVANGKWAKGNESVELPAVTADDNGKVLMVVEGVWAVADIPTNEPK